MTRSNNKRRTKGLNVQVVPMMVKKQGITKNWLGITKLIDILVPSTKHFKQIRQW